MEKFFTLILLISTLSLVQAQKIYVWCPPTTQIGSASGKLSGVRINLLIADARNIADSSKVECTSDEIKQAIANEIILAYPSAIINLLENELYESEAEADKITIRVGISAYHSASGIDVSSAIGNAGGNFNWGELPKNRWNSVTGYHVIIDDYRNGSLHRQTRDIANIVSRPNIGGSLTARKALNEAYQEANRELLYFIENSFAK